MNSSSLPSAGRAAFLIPLLTALFLGACVPAPSLTRVPTPATEILISETAEAAPIGKVLPYQDVRFKTLTDVFGNLDESLIETLWFNEATTWPSTQEEVAARQILEQGKNPGLGMRRLHAEGITGKGVNVAIIDQNIVLDHPQFRGKIVEYHDVGTAAPPDESSMHGPAVTSLLVGEDIGTAPGARLYFVAVPSWALDAQYQADALNWIVDENAKLPQNAKIRVVSVSAAPSGPGSPFTKNNAAWDAARKRAEEAGILVLDCTADHMITAPCYLNLSNPDDVTNCTPGWPGMDGDFDSNRIYVPTSRRTTAEVYQEGQFSYQYTGRGGMSLAIPYLAGTLALGWQVNPQLTGTQLVDMLLSSAYVRDGKFRIINPPAFIALVKASLQSP